MKSKRLKEGYRWVPCGPNVRVLSSVKGSAKLKSIKIKLDLKQSNILSKKNNNRRSPVKLLNWASAVSTKSFESTLTFIETSDVSGRSIMRIFIEKQ